MNGLRYTWFVLMCVALLYLATAPTLSFAKDEQPLIEVLTSDAPRGEKAMAAANLYDAVRAANVPAHRVAQVGEERCLATGLADRDLVIVPR